MRGLVAANRCDRVSVTQFVLVGVGTTVALASAGSSIASWFCGWETGAVGAGTDFASEKNVCKRGTRRSSGSLVKGSLEKRDVDLGIQ